MKKMVETFRPGVTGIFKHLPPECQKSRNNEDFNMDDDMCGKSGLVKTGGCKCASTLGSVILYSAASCVCREYTRVGKNGGKTGGCACTSTLEAVNL